MNTEEFAESLEAVITQLTDLLNNIDLIESTDEELAETADRVHFAKTTATDLYDFYQDKVVNQIGYTAKPITTSGSTIEIKQGAPRKSWDHDALTELVARRIYESSIDLDTGEFNKSPQDMMRELMKYGAVSYWRVSALKDLNIDADEYCEVGESKKKLVVRRNK